MPNSALKIKFGRLEIIEAKTKFQTKIPFSNANN